ncbi:hypothetical protein COOONC_06320 [Cooperia oncophora]
MSRKRRDGAQEEVQAIVELPQMAYRRMARAIEEIGAALSVAFGMQRDQSRSRINPVCPNNGVPQSSPAGYKSCTMNTFNDCDPGFSCVQAVNDFSVQLCCSTGSSAEPVCPNQRFLLKERGRPVYCSASQPQLCPVNYPCESAVGAPGTYVCCSALSTISCPARYSPKLDTNGNKALLLPRTEVKAGYTCQYSANLTQYVCCASESTTLNCADGRNVYEQIAGETYMCNPQQVPSSCPVGYECAPSTLPGTNVCCAKNADPPVTLAPLPSNTECPAGWDPYRSGIDGKEKSCNGAFDTTNQPNQCPRGYSCDQSIVPSIAVCCSSAASPERLLCPNGGTPSLLNGFIRSCPVEGQTEGCPNGNKCERATTGMLVCCPSVSPSTEVCPQNRQPIFSQITNDYIYCDDTAYICANEYKCLPMVNSDRFLCCSDIPKCIQGTPEMYLVGRVKRCSSSSDCGRGFLCSESNVGGVRVCCSSGAIPARDVRIRIYFSNCPLGVLGSTEMPT